MFVNSSYSSESSVDFSSTSNDQSLEAIVVIVGNKKDPKAIEKAVKEAIKKSDKKSFQEAKRLGKLLPVKKK